MQSWRKKEFISRCVTGMGARVQSVCVMNKGSQEVAWKEMVWGGGGWDGRV